jgi:hypothetical protein
MGYMALGQKHRWIGIVVLTIALTGCATKLLYRNLDWFILDYIEDYVSLDRDQEKIVKVQLKQLIDWHQKNELKQYSKQIDELSALTLNAITEDDLNYHSDQFTSHIYRLAERVAPDIYALSQLATDEQLAEFLTNYEKQGAERQQEYQEKTDQERIEDRAESMIESAERWLGNLTIEQTQILEEWAANRVNTRPLWNQHRTEMGDRMKTLFARRYDVINYQTQMYAILTEPDQFYSPALETQLEQSKVLSRDYLLRLVQSTNEQQQDHFTEELQDWKNIINNLSSE